MLAGVGIAYKLAQALCQTMPERVAFDLADLLDLVAIGTVADLAPLLGENRILVDQGLAVLNSARRPGVMALAQVARLKPGQMSAESIAFGLGPRLNAAGRLSHAYDAAKLLAVNNMLQAEKLARQLDQLNRERQRITADLTAKAEAMVSRKVTSSLPPTPTLFLAW
ncbi:MAG: DHH family phosphoesterase [Chloroflexi bacterium]|nr:DHH family phosphoesterase [Chloroflexota bacterium]